MSIEWFPGSIEEAIENASAEDRLLITFIDGADKPSAKLLRYLNEPTTSAKIKENHIKIFKISTNDEEFKKFSTTYKTVPVPSIFFLDRRGKPLGLITSDIISPDALELKFDRILDKLPKIESVHTSQKYSNYHFNTKTNEYSTDEEVEKEVTRQPGKIKPLQENAPKQLTERDRIRQMIAVDRYELSQRQAYLAGGEDLRTVSVGLGPSTKFLPKNEESKVYDNKKEEETKSEIPTKSKVFKHKDVPQLTNLMISFTNGETRCQHFSYKSPFGAVRGYIEAVVQNDQGNYNFYVTATSPKRVLVPELDKVSLENLGLIPVAELIVHLDAQKADIENQAEIEPKNVIQKLGGFYTILGVLLWIAISPVMVGTNWCGFCDKPVISTSGEEVSSWMYNALQTMPKTDGI